MAYQGINTGTSPNSGTGDSLIEGAEKINSNFIELYNVVGNGTTTYVGIVTQITAGTNVSISTAYGSVEVSASTPSQLTTTNLSVSGISTLTNVSSNTLVVAGVSTLGVVTGVTYYGNGSNLVGVVTTLDGADASNVVGITTLVSAGNNISVTTNSGISTISYIGAANTSNIVANSLVVSGVSTLGVVTGATYYGDGSNLTGVVTTLNGANASDVVGITTLISAGNNISVTTNSGISTISYTGIANTANINADSINVSGLSTFTGNVSCGQSILIGNTGKILIGTTPDLQVYHDGSNSYIAETGTGALRIDSSFTELRNATGTARAATFSLGTGASGGAQLYFNGIKKFQTTSVGSLVTGITTSTEGFSSGTGGPVQISVVGTTLTFTVVGIGSTTLTLS